MMLVTMLTSIIKLFRVLNRAVGKLIICGTFSCEGNDQHESLQSTTEVCIVGKAPKSAIKSFFYREVKKVLELVSTWRGY